MADGAGSRRALARHGASWSAEPSPVGNSDAGSVTHFPVPRTGFLSGRAPGCGLAGPQPVPHAHGWNVDGGAREGPAADCFPFRYFSPRFSSRGSTECSRPRKRR